MDKIIEWILDQIAKWKINGVFEELQDGGTVIKVIIKIVDLWFINPWYIIGPLIGITILILAIAIIGARIYNK